MRISDWSSDVCSSDLQTFPLADRIVDKALVPAKHPAIDMDDRPAFVGIGPDLAHNARIVAIGDETDVLAVRLQRHGKIKRFRNFPHLRSEEHTSELQSLMRISYAVFCLKKKTTNT